MYVGVGSDYYGENGRVILQIGACQQRQCFSICIVDDYQLEEVETFDISLLRNGLGTDIAIGWESTRITIEDDDSKLE